MIGLDGVELNETEILRINNEELTKLIESLQASPQKENLEKYIYYLQQFILNPTPGNALIINLLSAEIQYPGDIRKPDYFKEPPIDKRLYLDKMKKAEESTGVSTALRVSSSQVVLQRARDLSEAVQQGRKGKEIDKFFEEKGWGGVSRMLVLGGSNNNYEKYSQVPAEISFVKQLNNEGRAPESIRGPYTAAYTSSVRMQTH